LCGYCPFILMICSSAFYFPRLIAHDNQPPGLAASATIAISACQGCPMSAVGTIDRFWLQNIGWCVTPRTA
jgi:hypothetical protein